jgi:hypothetical protein
VNASLQHILKMNVSKEADAAFMAEVKREDPERYERLLKNMLKQATRLRRLSQPGTVTTIRRKCEHCRLALPPDLRSDARYCDRTCERTAKRSRAAVRQSQIAA